MAHKIRITSADRHAGAMSAFMRVFDAPKARSRASSTRYGRRRYARSPHTTLPLGSRQKLRRFIAARAKAREHDHATGPRR
jgi:hypothetical protein